MSLAVYLALALYPGTWSDMRPATCMPDECFCEAIRAGPIRQPSNTASGLIFIPVAAGLLALSSTLRSGQPAGPQALILRRPVYMWIFAGATALVGATTAFYHASLSFIGQTADVLAMYLVATFLVLYGAARTWRLTDSAAAWFYVFGNAALFWFLVTWPDARRYVFAVLVVAAVALELAVRRRGQGSADARYFGGAVALLGAGFGIWLLDITGTLCAPHSLLQGHALWHAAGAGSLALVFQYFASEAPAGLDTERSRRGNERTGREA